MPFLPHLAHCTSQFNTELGRGTYKHVFKGFDTERGVEVAWVADRGVVDNFAPAKSQMRSEIDILERLTHKNILAFIGWFELPSPSKPVVMIVELMSWTLKQ